MKATSAWSSASTSTGARGYNARQGRGEWGALGRTRARGCGREGHAGRCLAGCLPSPAHGVVGGAAGARRSGHGPKRPFWTTPPRMPTRGRRERALPPRTLSNTVCASGHFRHRKLHVRPLYIFWNAYSDPTTVLNPFRHPRQRISQNPPFQHNFTSKGFIVVLVCGGGPRRGARRLVSEGEARLPPPPFPPEGGREAAGASDWRGGTADALSYCSISGWAGKSLAPDRSQILVCPGLPEGREL